MIHILSFASNNPDRQRELREGISSLTDQFTLEFAKDGQEAIAKIANAEILLAHFITPELFAAAKKMRWIHLSSAGVERNLFPEFVRSDIVLTNSSGIHAAPMSEWAVASLLYTSQRFDIVENWRRNREWETPRRELFEKRFVLKDKRALIVGYGSVGRPIADRLRCLGIYCEAVASSSRTDNIPVHSVSDLPNLIGTFDIVVIAVPYTPKTNKLFDEQLFSKIKPGAILVNLARGKVIDEKILIQALKSGKLSFAALDVFEQEPLPEDSPLFDLPNLFMTPHVSGNFPEYTHRVHELFLENLNNYIHNRPLKHIVDKSRGY